ncbi:MAG: NAD+ synthase [Phycisphaerales bacterium]
MRVAVAQLDPIVGDLDGNATAIRRAAETAARDGAEIFVAGELALVGYPPRDLLERPGLAGHCLRHAEAIGRAVPSLTFVLGLPRRVEGDRRPLRNSAAIVRGGRIEGFADKRLLPSYDVFDEDRFFTPGERSFAFEHRGRRVGVVLCEDLWQAEDAGGLRRYEIDPVAELVADGLDVLLVPSASPFVRGKHRRHLSILSSVAKRHRISIVSINQTGGNDELVFDGGSAVVGPDGSVRHRFDRFAEAVGVVETDLAGCVAAGRDDGEASEGLGELFSALICGIRGYCRKTGHDRVLLGLSGGIDSAVVAALAAAAIGPERVRGVMMPSRHSSRGSLVDARASAEALGLGRLDELPIEPMHAAFATSLVPAIGTPEGVADENLQSRARGTVLMAIANATGELLLATGNKSEYAVGYSTLYGDMNGGLAPIGDVLKTDLVALARWMNRRHLELGFPAPPVPTSSIEKPPSAELRPDQTDQDSLPPYEVLDAVVRGVVERGSTIEEIAAEIGRPIEFVRELAGRIDRNEFKRKQAPPILKTSPRAFGRGRPMPLAGRWNPGDPPPG